MLLLVLNVTSVLKKKSFKRVEQRVRDCEMALTCSSFSFWRRITIVAAQDEDVERKMYEI